jgi:hypothetical protein
MVASEEEMNTGPILTNYRRIEYKLIIFKLGYNTVDSSLDKQACLLPLSSMPSVVSQDILHGMKKCLRKMHNNFMYKLSEALQGTPLACSNHAAFLTKLKEMQCYSFGGVV